MNGFTAADMTDARAKGYKDRVEFEKDQQPIGYRWRHSASESWQYSNFPCGWEHQPLYAAPVAAAPVDLNAHGLRALDNCIRDLRRLLELAEDFALDEMQIQSLLTAIESMELRKVASTPAAPGIDLEQFKDLIGFAAWNAINLPETDPRRDFIRQASELRALINASPKGVTLHNDGSSEAQFIADTERLNCPACGGSGHVDDSPKGGSTVVTDAMVNAALRVKYARAGSVWTGTWANPDFVDMRNILSAAMQPTSHGAGVSE